MRSNSKKEINILVGNNIRLYREKQGISREKLAELVGITPRFLADAELGFVGVSLTNLKKICEVLGVSSDRILWCTQEEITITEKLSHIPKEYISIIEEIIQKQIEIITLATKEPKRNTRN